MKNNLNAAGLPLPKKRGGGGETLRGFVSCAGVWPGTGIALIVPPVPSPVGHADGAMGLGRTRGSTLRGVLHRAEHKVRPYELVRIAVALVLLCAAGLKAQSLLSPLAGTEAFSGWERAIGPLAIGVEWLMGIWLLSGIAQAWARRGALALLSIFSLVSAWRLFSGRADCGCFGNVHVFPVWTLAFDFLALSFMYFLGREAFGDIPLAHRRGLATRRMTIAVLASLCIPPAAAVAGYARTPRDAVFLGSPASWIGKPLPLLPYADESARADLSSGPHTVILFNRQCDECRAFLKRLADKQLSADQITSIRLADIAAPDAPAAADIPRKFHEIRLRQDRLYVVKFPLKIILRNGIVQSVEQPE